MTVATDLQNLVAEVSAAIAGGQPWGRVELERLRRTASAIAEEARSESRVIATTRRHTLNLVDAIDAAVADLPGLARRVRTRIDGLCGDDA